MYVTQASLLTLATQLGLPDGLATDARVLLLCNGARLWRLAHPSQTAALTKEEIVQVAHDLGVPDKVSAHPGVRELCNAVTQGIQP